MLRWIVDTSLRLRVLVVVVAALIMVFGVAQLRQMPVDVLPEFSPPYVEIQTESLGLSAEEVEQLITTPMEQDLLVGLPWVQSFRSQSVPGLSSVVLTFLPGTDLMKARQMVSERMTQAVAMPHVSKPPIMLQPLSATSRVMIIGLSSKTVSPIQMSVLARWTIQPRLLGVPGVANVSIWGQRDRQLQVQIDPARLLANNVALLQVLETTGNALWVSSLSFVEASTPGTGGFIDIPNQRLGIRHISPIVSPAELAQIPIDGTKLVLSDVAKVVENNQPLIGDAIASDGPSLLLVVEKFPNANTLEVTRGLDDAMAELKPGLPGIDVDTSLYRPADFIETSIGNVGRSLVVGFVLLAVLLIAFFRDIRAAFISFIAIPLSLVAACLVLHLVGGTFNMMVLTGLVAATGVLICDAIAGVDHIRHRLRDREDRTISGAFRSIIDSATDDIGTFASAVPIMLLAISPTIFMSGTTGAFFRPLAIAYGLAILSSMLVMLTVTPALCVMLLARERGTREIETASTGLRRTYEAALSQALKRPALVAVVVGVLVAIGFASTLFLQVAPMPSFKEQSFVIHLKAAPGTAQPEMSRISGRMRDELRKIPGVRNVSAHVGRALLGDQIVDVNSAQLWVSIDPSANYNVTAGKIKKVVEGYPGLGYSVQTYFRKTSGDIIQEPAANLVVRVYGDRYEVLGSTATGIKNAIKGIDGIEEVKLKMPLLEPTLTTEVKLAEAQQHGLKPGDVRRAAACLLSGIQVGALYEDQKVFDVVVWSTPETRHDIDGIRNLTIDAPTGKRVRLGEVADVRIVPAASVIHHDGVKRYVDLVVDVNHRDLAAVAVDIRKQLTSQKFSLETYAKVLGEYATPKESRDHQFILGGIAAAGIYFLLQAAFGSWRLATMVFLTVPVALIGGLFAATALEGTVLSLGSLAGLLAIFSVAICANIAIVRRFQRTAVESDPQSAESIVSECSDSSQLGLIVAPAIAIAALLSPVLFFGDVAGLEIIHPMAIVILAGLVTSTLFSVFGLPVLLKVCGADTHIHRDDFDLSNESM